MIFGIFPKFQYLPRSNIFLAEGERDNFPKPKCNRKRQFGVKTEYQHSEIQGAVFQYLVLSRDWYEKGGRRAMLPGVLFFIPDF